ncbi:MAG: MarR family winged helix-turn-helix transcriptional regulator [Nitrososphaerales archaeon]
MLVGEEEDKKELVLAETIAAGIHDIWRSARIMEPFVRAEKITLEQYWILRLLYETGPCRIKDIAARIGTTSSPVTISVKRLERRSFLKRERSTKDERVVSVRLTGYGRTVFESWRKKRRKSLSRLFDSLDRIEKRTLLKLLEKVVASDLEAKLKAPQTTRGARK